MRKLAAENILTEGTKWAALPGHVVRFSPFQQVKVDKLMLQFSAAPYAPPRSRNVRPKSGEDIYSALLEFGDLQAVSDEVVFRKSDYDSMVEKIRLAILQKGQISLAEVRDLFNTSRRYAQALLEHLDATSVTIRSGISGN